MARSSLDAAYDMLTSEDDGRVCRDIPETACRHQPANFLTHVACLTATKTGDGLFDAKLVLAWLLGALGAPTGLIGLLVPVREAGALLPQLLTAASIRRLPVRKWVWAAGSVVQGLCVIGVALVALGADGAVAGWSLIGLLAVFSLARSACSVAYKDVLGKTVSKATRGTATGTADSLSALGVLAFGLALASGWLPTEITTIAIILIIAGTLWLFAAGLFATLNEEPGATEGGGHALRRAIEQFGLLMEDPQLRCFIASRGLLTATALSPPFLLALAGSAEAPLESGLGTLGLFIVASGLASMSSGYIWGRLSDLSSRRVLVGAGLIAALTLALSATLAWSNPAALHTPGVLPALLFGLLIAHRGVRLGRSTHLVDMAGADRRAAYTALSNTIIGVLLLAGGAFGFLAQSWGITPVVAIFAVMSLGGSLVATRLAEVQA